MDGQLVSTNSRTMQKIEDNSEFCSIIFGAKHNQLIGDTRACPVKRVNEMQ